MFYIDFDKINLLKKDNETFITIYNSHLKCYMYFDKYYLYYIGYSISKNALNIINYENKTIYLKIQFSLCNKIKYLGLDTVIKLSSEYIICHSSVLKLSSHMNQWYKNERKVNNYFRPENSDEKSKLIHNFGKKREEFKKIPRKLSFYELDLSEYDHQAVAIVVKAMYNGKLEYPKDKKMAVMRMARFSSRVCRQQAA